MNNFHERQTHLLLVVGVAAIEIAFFTVMAVVGGDSSAMPSYSLASTNTTLTSNTSSSSSQRPSTGTASHSSSSSTVPPPPMSIDSSALREEVVNALNNWKTAAEAHDLNSYMNCYADAVDYYKAKGWDRSRVRVDKQRAFSAYERFQISLENILVSLDHSGVRATVLMDKTWTFTRVGKSNTGSVRQQMTLVKSGGRWLITGENDVKVYYSRSY